MAPHPTLDVAYFVTHFSQPLGQIQTPTEIIDLFSTTTQAPHQSSDQIREAIRALLRHGGYKPTGRGKPSSEYLIKASAENNLNSINIAVDIGNAVSLHSGLPISVIDIDRTEGPLKIQIASPKETYIFNASGQTIDVSGLLCLFDSQGACANAVKDAQRTKTSQNTVRTLSIIWGTNKLASLTPKITHWYQQLLNHHNAQTTLL